MRTQSCDRGSHSQAPERLRPQARSVRQVLPRARQTATKLDHKRHRAKAFKLNKGVLKKQLNHSTMLTSDLNFIAKFRRLDSGPLQSSKSRLPVTVTSSTPSAEAFQSSLELDHAGFVFHVFSLLSLSQCLRGNSNGPCHHGRPSRCTGHQRGS